MVQSTLDSGRNFGVTRTNYAFLVIYSKTTGTWRSKNVSYVTNECVKQKKLNGLWSDLFSLQEP